jgi:hypothetical protein
MRGARPRGWRTLLVCAGLLAVACASAKPLPAYVTNPIDPKFPSARFIVEYGTSTVSAGDAELIARAKIAQDLKSEISAEVRSYVGQLEGKESQRASDEIVQRTSFERNDLVRPVDAQQVNGTFYSRVALERGHADAEYARAQSSDLTGFSKYAELALQAAKEGKTGDFATAHSRAQHLIPQLDSSFVMRRSILGHPSDDERQFVLTRVLLQKAAADIDTHRVVVIRVEGLPSPLLMQLAVAAVRKLGPRVGEDQTCAQLPEHQAEATELVLSPEETCGESTLGERCVIAIRLHARGCTGSGDGEGRIGPMPGIHPSDRDRARAAAWKRVTPDAVELAVGQALRGAQVVGCSGAGC